MYSMIKRTSNFISQYQYFDDQKYFATSSVSVPQSPENSQPRSAASHIAIWYSNVGAKLEISPVLRMTIAQLILFLLMLCEYQKNFKYSSCIPLCKKKFYLLEKKSMKCNFQKLCTNTCNIQKSKLVSDI